MEIYKSEGIQLEGINFKNNEDILELFETVSVKMVIFRFQIIHLASNALHSLLKYNVVNLDFHMNLNYIKYCRLRYVIAKGMPQIVL